MPKASLYLAAAAEKQKPSRQRALSLFLCFGAFAALACGGPEPPGDPEDGGGEELEGLRAAAARAGKLIGTAVDARALDTDAEYAAVLAREFDYVTPENATKWEPLEPRTDDYSWEDADAIIGFAEEHDQQVKGHTFVWHRQVPNWVNASLSAQELSDALKEHIETTLERYRGRVRAWDVVNEAVDVASPSGYTESVFYNTLGPTYIEEAFRWARAADPDVLLFYNEVGIERMGPKSDFTYDLMKDLLERGVPIDGIGLQSHVSTHRYPSADDLRANIRRFADLGLSVNISEADARTVLMPGDRESRWHAQQLAFQQIVGVCATEPACEAITLWGFTDKFTWINDDSPEPDDPLVFDRDYVAKPAYEGVLAGLAGELPTLGENLVANGDFSEGSEGWSVTAGTLDVVDASERSGAAACASERSADTDGLRQTELTQELEQGGALAFSAWVRLGEGEATIEAALNVQTADAESEQLSLASGTARAGEWTQLSGYFGVAFEAEPTAIELVLYGPPAGVEICISDVEIRRLSP